MEKEEREFSTVYQILNIFHTKNKINLRMKRTGAVNCDKLCEMNWTL